MAATPAPSFTSGQIVQVTRPIGSVGDGETDPAMLTTYISDGATPDGTIAWASWQAVVFWRPDPVCAPENITPMLKVINVHHDQATAGGFRTGSHTASRSASVV